MEGPIADELFEAFLAGKDQGKCASLRCGIYYIVEFSVPARGVVVSPKAHAAHPSVLVHR